MRHIEKGGWGWECGVSGAELQGYQGVTPDPSLPFMKGAALTGILSHHSLSQGPRPREWLWFSQVTSDLNGTDNRNLLALKTSVSI